MTCPAYGSSSNMALYYAVDADPSASISGSTITWTPVPITSDSLAATLTSSISEQINATRSYANSVVTQGEVSGSFGFEAEASTFVNEMIQAAIQDTGTWNKGASITNGSDSSCLMFLKKVARGATADYYVFRGVQVDSMSFSITPGSFITGEISVIGTRMGAGVLGATGTENDIINQTNFPVSWTLGSATSGNLMSSVFALQNFEVQNADGTDVGVIIQKLTLNLSNQLRAQFAVGTGSPYAAGVASGRFQATLTGNAYYSGPEIINGMLRDDELRILFNLVDADNVGWRFLFDKCKVTAAPPPAASGPDQDVMSSTEFQAFQSDAHGTVEIMRLSGYTEGTDVGGVFDTDLDGWAGTGWAFATDHAEHTPGAANALAKSLSVTSGTTYKVVVTVENTSAGSFEMKLGTADIPLTAVGDPSSSAVFTGLITASATASTAFSLIPTTDYDGDVMSISVKPLTWT